MKYNFAKISSVVFNGKKFHSKLSSELTFEKFLWHPNTTGNQKLESQLSPSKYSLSNDLR